MSFIKKHLETLLILAGIAFAIFAFAVGAPLPNSRERLTAIHEGNNWIYRQNRTPTAAERKAGAVALKKWSSARMWGRSSLANEIVLSRVLIGLTQKEIVENMGPPDAFSFLNEIGRHENLTGYNARYFFEDQCDLMINLNDDGKATEVYLDVNY